MTTAGVAPRSRCGAEMFREKATQLADLPHRFEGTTTHCLLCAAGLLDARHVAWEKAALTPPSNPWFTDRERGV